MLFVLQRNSYAEVYSFLESKGFRYGKDFIDATAVLEIARKKLHGYEYERIPLSYRYAPWRDDTQFTDVYESVRKNTLLDVFRLYELWSLTRQTKEMPAGDILEVGVWRGGSGALLASAAREFCPSACVCLADTFSGVVKTSRMDDSYTGGEHCDTSEETVRQLLAGLELLNAQIFRGVFPDEFGDNLLKNCWRLVHIDVDVYLSARDTFECIWPHVLPGGIVVFDDYGFSSTNGITTLCNELKEKTTDGMFIYNLNGHGIFIKN